jgi:hypothetical protein
MHSLAPEQVGEGHYKLLESIEILGWLILRHTWSFLIWFINDTEIYRSPLALVARVGKNTRDGMTHTVERF